MRFFLTVIILCILNDSPAQSFLYPIIKEKVNLIDEVIPGGWKILDSVYGDLNKDSLADIAIILQRNDSVLLANDVNDSTLTQPRILLIYFRNHTSNNSFKLICQSNSFILCDNNPAMEDPYDGISINKGIIEIKFHQFYTMGSWYTINSTYKFRYQQNEFYLIGADYRSMHRASGEIEDYSYNFQTKKRSLIKSNTLSERKKTNAAIIKLPFMKTLKTFIKPFTWQVEKDVYL